MTDYTEREVYLCISELKSIEPSIKDSISLIEIGRAIGMLTQLADMLAEREKAEPVAWLYVDAAGEPASTQFQPSSDFNIPLYTHPAAQPRVPDGYVMVPIKPTDAMHNAARDWSRKKYGQGIGNDASAGCWKAMVFAAQESGR